MPIPPSANNVSQQFQPQRRHPAANPGLPAKTHKPNRVLQSHPAAAAGKLHTPSMLLLIVIYISLNLVLFEVGLDQPVEPPIH